MAFDCFDNPDARSFRVRLPDPGPERVALARLLAVHIVEDLAYPSQTAFAAWQSRLEGGPAHPASDRAEIEAYVQADFRNPGDTTRITGAVVEHLWALLASELDGDWGRPFMVQHDHFSVIDHGGDGLAIYEINVGADLRFRLWESKAHDGQRSVTTIITDAAKQMKKSAAEYVARASKPLQLHEDERVRVLAGTIVKLWTAEDARSAVGISVGTSALDGLPRRPFRGLRREFNFPEPGRLEGLVIEIADLDAFAEQVRWFIVTGIE